MSENKMSHCPKCHKPLLNGANFSGNAQFNLRCPWCQTIVTVSVQQQIVANVKTPDMASLTGEMAEFYRSGGAVNTQAQTANASLPESGFKVVGFLYPEKEDNERKPSM